GRRYPEQREAGLRDGGLPAAAGKLWRAEAGERSAGRLQRGRSPARPSAPGTIALSLQQGAAAPPSGVGREEGKGGDSWRKSKGHDGRGTRKVREKRREEGQREEEEERNSERTVAANTPRAKRHRTQL
ncbi:unnamed protein product, partial [Gulo gulo]